MKKFMFKVAPFVLPLLGITVWDYVLYALKYQGIWAS